MAIDATADVEDVLGSSGGAAGNSAIQDVFGEEMAQDDEVGEDDLTNDQLAWRTNAFYLYDLFIGCELEWPALSVSWLLDEPNELPRIAIGLHTDGSVPNELLVVEMSVAQLDRLEWSGQAVEGIGKMESFGCTGLDEGSPLRTVARMRHPTEVNRVAPSPHLPQLIATKAATGAVLLFDHKSEKQEAEATLLSPGTPVDGFALSWSRLEKNMIASGGLDGRLCIWDIEGCSGTASSTGPAPARSFIAHKGPLCDISFSSFAPGLLASVGDDRQLHIWDTRISGNFGCPQSSAVISEDDVLTVDWSYRQEWLLATAGKDQVVKVWDSRSLKSPVKSLCGHSGDVVAVRWSPLSEDLLASCSDDSMLCLWDLRPEAAHNLVDDPENADDAEDPPELMFSHAGHSFAGGEVGAGVSDFSWSAADDVLLCSVGQDNSLQIWHPSRKARGQEESDSEAADEDAVQDPAAKRPRLSESVGI